MSFYLIKKLETKDNFGKKGKRGQDWARLKGTPLIMSPIFVFNNFHRI